jgi:alkanesulfonate monooxygenase SsuD/methylene tetrahydromethanopterin reductase-like flavin-dependent oxidoreductase (luciferase family)
MTKVGYVLGSTVPPVLLPAVSRAIEDAGFDSIWMSEDYYYTGGVAGAATALGVTESISVGIGLLPIYTRHPALVAMEAGALAGAFPGRFKVGFGSGVPAWLDQMGIAHAAPLGTMREVVGSVRRLLAGERVSGGKYHTFQDIALTFPPAELPDIYIGATGPKMLGVAGELADGVLMSVLATPKFVAGARALVDATRPAGAERAVVTAFAIFSLADTLQQARDKARPVVAEYLSLGMTPLSDGAGLTDEVNALIAKGGHHAVLEEMPDEWIDRLAVVGDAATCRRAIDDLIAAGADEIALVPVDTTDLIGQIASNGPDLGLVTG